MPPSDDAFRVARALSRRPPPPPDARHQAVTLETTTDFLASWAFPQARSGGDWDDARALARGALETLLSDGLSVGRDSAGAPLFDPCDVVNTLTWDGQRGVDTLWRRRRFHHLATDLAARVRDGEDADGGASSVRARLLLRRDFELGGLTPRRAAPLRLPLPLEGPDHRVSRISAEATTETGVDLRLADGRLEARLSFLEIDYMTLRAEVDITAGDGPARSDELDDGQRRLWLRPIEGLIRISQRVSALADHLAGGGSDRATVVAIWNYLIDSFCLGAIRYDAFPADLAMEWAIAHRWFDCQLGASLLIALCRSRGIPARLIGGHFLYASYPVNHYWAEVWLEDEGWLPLDLASWSLSGGGEEPEWRDRFFLRLEPRLVTQRFPRRITGPIGVRFPERWRMLPMQTAGGVSITFTEVESSGLIHEDHIDVVWPTPPPAGPLFGQGRHGVTSLEVPRTGC